MVLSFKEVIEKTFAVPGTAYDEQVRRVIRADRKCGEFTQWRQGFSPKEHQEMIDKQMMLKLEDERMEREAQREERHEERARRWHQEDLEQERAWRANQEARQLEAQTKTRFS
jgi:hypothetical protein